MAAKINESRLIFDNLSRKLSSLAYLKSKNDKLLLSKLLSDFTLLNYGESWEIVNEKAVLVINQCCFLVPHGEILMVKLVLNLFHCLLTKQNISVEGKTLAVATAWVLDCIKSKSSDIITPALSVLQELVRGKAGLIVDHGENILQICKQLLSEYAHEEPPNVYLNCLNCIESLAFCDELSDVSEPLILKCCDIFINLLYGQPELKNQVWQCKCYIVAMRGLGNIADKKTNLLSGLFPELFGVIKGYMLYGIPGQDGYKIEKVVPSNVALPDQLRTSPVKKAMGKYDRRSKKKAPTPITAVAKEDDEKETTNGYIGTSEGQLPNLDITSDSDFSDGEGGVAGKLRSLQTKLRRCSLILLGSLLLNGDSKNTMRFLPSLLPDGTTIPHSRTLVTCLLSDTSPSCRSEVLVVLSIILTKFKRFMALADGLSKSSFTSISNSVASMVIQLHLSLSVALKTENYKIVTTHILKTISDLIRCSPYHKLEPGLITNLVKELFPVLKKKDVNAQIAALVVFGCVTSIEPKVEEIRKIIFGNFGDDINRNFDGRPWLFDQCTKFLSDETGCNPAVAVECLQVLAALVRNFPYDILLTFPNDVIAVLEFTSPRHDFLIRLYAAKLTEATVSALQSGVKCEDESRRTSVGQAANIWNKIIFGPVSALILCEDQPALRSAGCDCLASVSIISETTEPGLIFDELPRSNQIVCITHLFGCAKDESPQVRSSAVRALAVFVQFTSLRQDSLFLLDAVDAFFTAGADENLGVRVQASWLFGHLAEAAVANKNEGLDEDLSDSMLVRLLDSGVKLANDAKKGKPYAVRGIANLLSMVTEVLTSCHRDEISRAVDALVQNASSGSFMKARWNACYALGTAMANPAVCADARSKAFPVLFDLVQQYKNFKVRISAGYALACLPNREAYGDSFLPAWRALLGGLENAENMDDFIEYQHRDHLVDQICSSMCHLVSIIIPDDLLPLQDILLHHIEPLSHQFSRFKNRIVPEKGSVISSADAKLSSMVAMETLGAHQRQALSLLCGTFLSDPK